MGGGGAEVWLSPAFPQHPSSVRDSDPNAFLQPHLHQRCCSRGGHPGLNCQGCSGACSASFSGLLQPSVRCMEDLGVVVSGHRPLPSQSLCGHVPLSDGDHSVRAPVSLSGGLDGLHRFEGSVSPSASSPGFSSLSTLRVQGSRVPVQGAVLWPLHGSAGLLSGHGSCFRHPPFYGDSYAQVPRRLACPVFLSGIPPPGSSDCPRSLPRVGNRGEPSEIPPSSITGGTVSWSRHKRRDFHGFSVAGAHLQAAINSRRISVLRLASCELVALAAGNAFFAGSPGSWRQTADAVSPAVPPSILGSSRSFVSGVSPRPPVVAPPSSPLPRCVSLPGVSRLDFWSDASDVGWGAHLEQQVASGLWDSHQAALSINARELLAIKLGLLRFQSSLRSRTVAVYCDNVTAVAYLRKEGGTRSPLLNSIAQEILRWSESPREAQGLTEDGSHSCGSALGSAPLVPRPAPALAGPSGCSSRPSRPPAPATLSASLPGSPSAQASCLETLQRFTRAAGFSSAVAEQSSLARRPSSRAIYQRRWSIYRSWCRENGHSISRPSLAKVADFLY